MATSAVAREAVFALRREIARIEGVLPARLEEPAAPGSGDLPDGGWLTRRHGRPEAAMLPTGSATLDGALGGGLPLAALTEIHGAETREAGIVAGFALGLVARAPHAPSPRRPLLWVAAGQVPAEAGEPYPPGLARSYGIAPETLLLASVARIEDALWVAEEAAALTGLAAVFLEVLGHARRLDLTATRRLHRRAQAAGRPVFLLRQAGLPEPTAAPVRLVAAAAPSGERRLLSGTLSGSIGPPAVTVTIARSRAGVPATATLEWNDDERAFRERRIEASRPQDHGAVVSPPADRAHPAPAVRPGLARRGGEGGRAA